MLKTKTQLLVIGAVSLATLFTSCDPKKEETLVPVGAYESGVFIVNEGPFGSGTGTVSYYNRNTKSIINDIFGLSNNAIPIGNILQSMNIINNKGYLVVNNASKIEIVNPSDFKTLGTITGFSQPRYILGISDSKAYVSQWVDGSQGEVKVVDLNSKTITKTITTGTGAEKMLKKGNFVYLTCKGGWGNDSVVTIINTTTDVVEKTLIVGANPSSIQEDINGNIWVLCNGQSKPYPNVGLDKTASLVRINPSTNTIDKTISFNNLLSSASELNINKNKNKLFFNFDNHVVSQDVSSSSFDNSQIIGTSFYGLGIDPTTDIIYGADAGDYSSAGKVLRYTNAGVALDTLIVGVIPSSFYFK